MDDHSDLLPSLNALHKHLCGLDFYKDFKDKLNTLNANLETKDDANPDAQPKTSVLAAGEKIKMRFESVEEYEQEWNDVFMIEAKAQIMRGSTTERQSVDDFLLKGIVIDKPFYNINLELAQNLGNTYRFYDFVILAKSDPEIPQATHLIGIVDYFSGHSLKLKCYMEENSEKYLQFYDLLTGDSQWKIQKICNLATLHREYQGIWAVSKVQFLESILDPQKVISGAQEFFEIPEKLRQVLVNMYNPSQMEAIQSSLKKAGVTLIQGPPGTGKTNTIRGILSVLLNSTQETRSKLLQASNLAEVAQPAPATKSPAQRKLALLKAMPWLRADFRDARDEDKSPIELPLEKHLVYPVSQLTDHHVAVPKFRDNVHFKPDRILICAPSNAAIDQIIRMVLLKGILDNEGCPTFPSLVRIGPNYHESLKEVSLEYMANNEINAHPNKTIAEVRTEILKRTKLICSTLSVAGSMMLATMNEVYDTVIVDEAAQSVEPSILIPLKYKCKRLIMIGDPNQLPATIFSAIAESKEYDRSMFQRMQTCGYPVTLLNEQYRMNRYVSKFISDCFYGGKLQDCPMIDDMIGEPPLFKNPALQYFQFFHSTGPEEFEGGSYQNTREIDLVVNTLEDLAAVPVDMGTVGVISPYSRQVYMIRERIKAHANKDIAELVEVNTVDGFQGREKDVIIFSCVRSYTQADKAHKQKSIGFLEDPRRMNVSLSRARLCLVVIGNITKLYESKRWRKLVDFTSALGNLFDLDGWTNQSGLPKKIAKFKIDSIIKHLN